MMIMERAMADDAGAEAVSEKAVDEFHLYTVPHPGLKDGETKQIEFIKGSQIRYQTELVYDGANLPHINLGYVRTQQHVGTQGNSLVSVYKVFENKLENGLGKTAARRQSPVLPAGRGWPGIHRGKPDQSHTEDRDGQAVLGTAFDVVGERKQTEFVQYASQNRLRESIEILIKTGRRYLQP